MAHMNDNDRKRIEFLVSSGLSPPFMRPKVICSLKKTHKASANVMALSGSNRQEAHNAERSLMEDIQSI